MPDRPYFCTVNRLSNLASLPLHFIPTPTHLLLDTPQTSASHSSCKMYLVASFCTGVGEAVVEFDADLAPTPNFRPLPPLPPVSIRTEGTEGRIPICAVP